MRNGNWRLHKCLALCLFQCSIVRSFDRSIGGTVVKGFSCIFLFDLVDHTEISHSLLQGAWCCSVLSQKICWRCLEAPERYPHTLEASLFLESMLNLGEETFLLLSRRRSGGGVVYDVQYGADRSRSQSANDFLERQKRGAYHR